MKQFLFVGLGNPGKEYEKTRHNVGWMFLDFVKNLPDAEFEEWKEKKKLIALVAEGVLRIQTLGPKDQIKEKKIILTKPTTFMNNSGLAVKKIVTRYALPVTRYSDDLFVIHDDLDIPFGECKIQINRGAAGHHGVESIIRHLGTKNFTRIRIGIAPRKNRGIPTFKKGILTMKADEYVLNNFSSQELEQLNEVFKEISTNLLLNVKSLS